MLSHGRRRSRRRERHTRKLQLAPRRRSSAAAHAGDVRTRPQRHSSSNWTRKARPWAAATHAPGRGVGRPTRCYCFAVKAEYSTARPGAAARGVRHAQGPRIDPPSTEKRRSWRAVVVSGARCRARDPGTCPARITGASTFRVPPRPTEGSSGVASAAHDDQYRRTHAHAQGELLRALSRALLPTELRRLLGVCAFFWRLKVGCARLATDCVDR